MIIKFMPFSYDNNGDRVVYDYETNEWVYPDDDYICLSGVKRKVCPRCNKPDIDLNNISHCDFCLQSLTVCDFISDACCGHGDDSDAYISFKDGRRWVLDKEWSRKPSDRKKH